MSTSMKGLGTPEKHDGSHLRIAIVHARWNSAIVSALVSGCRKKLLASGVKEENVVVESVPGSWELPAATQRIYAASQVQASKSSASAGGSLISATADLLSSTSVTDLTSTSSPTSSAPSKPSKSSSALIQPFDAIIAIGVLIKGETMHFEYIADAVSHGLMKVQLEPGVCPVVLGVLTVLNEEQGKARAGIAADGKGHNHGEDWADAAVELGSKGREWKEGLVG